MTEFVNVCCADPGNREDGPGPRGGETPDDMTVTHCRVCDCRHFEVTVDPVLIGVEGKGL